MMRRIFIAVSPSVALQQRLTDLISTLQTAMPFWRWMMPANIHLTLRFLGNMSADRVEELHDALTSNTQEQEPFSLSIRSLGCFPTAAHPRVLWVGLDDSARTLESLYKQISTALVPLGFPIEDRPFRPHLTLARAKPRVVYRQLDTVLQQYHGYYVGDFPVYQLHVLQSELHSKGPIYTIMHTIPLLR